MLQPEPGVALGSLTDADEPSNTCIADVRLDNRAELSQLLGNCASQSDWELLSRGYGRWGTELADRLRGDFALAIWDPTRRALYAARDPFGVRPLYYCAVQSWLVVASEIESILATGVADRRLEDVAILEFLKGEHFHLRETFFANVYRVLPGHWLLADSHSIREERYWKPPRGDLRLQPDDYPREFRKLFQTAVADRLESDSPIAAQLSGGLDSSSIVCMVEEIAGSAKGGAPELHTVSAVYPDLECDESRWIDEVAKSVRFPSHRWDGTEPSPLSPKNASMVHPWGGTWGGSMDGDLRLARQLGAAVLLSGFGGDELLFERGVFRDLAKHGRWFRLLRETVLGPRVYSSRRGAEFIADAFRSTIPGRVRRAYRRIRPRPPATAPAWLGFTLRPFWLPAAPAVQSDLADETRQCLWNWLTNPNLWWSVELQVQRAARYGLEMRFPFLDRRLADFVLGIPYEHRLPGGRMKRLLRNAMTGTVPSAILRRRRVTAFDCLAGLSVNRHGAQLRNLFSGERWLNAPYVNQKAVGALFQTVDKSGSKCSNWPLSAMLLKFAQLELWLRARSEPRSGFAAREPPMTTPDPIPAGSNLAPDDREKKGQSSDEPPTSAYEAPCLTPIGNLRNLLGKTGARQDFGPGPRRT